MLLADPTRKSGGFHPLWDENRRLEVVKVLCQKNQHISKFGNLRTKNTVDGPAKSEAPVHRWFAHPMVFCWAFNHPQ